MLNHPVTQVPPDTVLTTTATNASFQIRMNKTHALNEVLLITSLHANVYLSL